MLQLDFCSRAQCAPAEILFLPVHTHHLGMLCCCEDLTLHTLHTVACCTSVGMSSLQDVEQQEKKNLGLYLGQLDDVSKIMIIEAA